MSWRLAQEGERVRTKSARKGVFDGSSRQRVLGTRGHHYPNYISFVLADGLDLATAWQIPALGLVLSEKGLFLRKRLRRVLYLVC